MDFYWLQGSELERLPAFATSLAIGLLIGLERERHSGTKAGLRTFALTALFATVAALLSDETGSPAIVVIGLLIVAAMIVTANALDREMQDPGTTTVVALLLCYGLAVMTWFEYQTLAVMLAIVITSLLYFKTELQGIAERLERRELISILQFAVLMFIVLPILPDQDFGPHGALNPNQIWTMVVLISGISLAGYVAVRLVGLRYGAPLLGLLGGLVSSTATTLIYARHARAQETLRDMAVLVIVLANLVLLVRLAVLAAVVAPALLGTLLPILGGGLLLGLASLGYLYARQGRDDTAPVPDIRNPAELRTALTFGALYALVLLLAAWLSDLAGATGLYAVAVVAGLTDVDAITLSSLRLFSIGTVDAREVAIAVVLAIGANIVFKLGMVLIVGGRPLFARCAGSMAAVVVGLVAVLLST